MYHTVKATNLVTVVLVAMVEVAVAAVAVAVMAVAVVDVGLVTLVMVAVAVPVEAMFLGYMLRQALVVLVLMEMEVAAATMGELVVPEHMLGVGLRLGIGHGLLLTMMKVLAS